MSPECWVWPQATRPLWPWPTRGMPGTVIPVHEESRLFEEQPEYALLLAWHIADELMPKLTEKGFKGDYIVPLPTPRIVKGTEV